LSYKTRELAKLLPKAYASDDAHSLLNKLLKVFGAELMVADEKVKQLLKSHWVNYASGRALDGLASIYGLRRRFLPNGTPEPDAVFRQRLKSVVPLFAGGGTRRAVLGAVRSALGLPFDLDQLNLPASDGTLRTDFESLVTLDEFSPTTERLLETGITEVEGATEVTLVVDIPSVEESRPQIRWTFPSGQPLSGNGRKLSVELVGALTESGAPVGIRSKDELLVRSGESLILSARANGVLNAAIGAQDKSGSFTNLDGTEPATMPEVPLGRSEWRFRAHGGLFDIGTFGDDTFVDDTFDTPRYEVEMSWTRYEPLSFDVRVPYFLENAVRKLERQHNLEGRIVVFRGLPQEAIQEVVDQTRAAGVRGHVHFSLQLPYIEDVLEEHAAQSEGVVRTTRRIAELVGVWRGSDDPETDPPLGTKQPLDFGEDGRTITLADGVRPQGELLIRYRPAIPEKPYEDHQQDDADCRTEATHRASEDARAADSLDVGSLNREAENHDPKEAFAIGGVWDVSTFDGSYGLQ
jgi:hypothetical protein